MLGARMAERIGFGAVYDWMHGQALGAVRAVDLDVAQSWLAALEALKFAEGLTLDVRGCHYGDDGPDPTD